jgi:hypothetical protein
MRLSDSAPQPGSQPQQRGDRDDRKRMGQQQQRQERSAAPAGGGDGGGVCQAEEVIPSLCPRSPASLRWPGTRQSAIRLAPSPPGLPDVPAFAHAARVAPAPVRVARGVRDAEGEVDGRFSYKMPPSAYPASGFLIAGISPRQTK